MALAGKSFVLKVATDAIGGTYYAVDEISNASMSVGADNLDITNFTATYRERIQGLKDVTYSLSGTYDSGDTNGQVAIFTAWSADSDLFVQFLPNGTAGWAQQVRVKKFELSADVADKVSVSIELEGTDAIQSV